jgi:hypothetical protein
MNDVRYIDVEIDCKKIGKMAIIFIKSTLAWKLELVTFQ